MPPTSVRVATDGTTCCPATTVSWQGRPHHQQVSGAFSVLDVMSVKRKITKIKKITSVRSSVAFKITARVVGQSPKSDKMHPKLMK